MDFKEINLLRANIIGGMDAYIRDVIGDEEITEHWLTYGLADGTDEYDLLADVDDEEFFEDCVACFKNCLYLNRQNN